MASSGREFKLCLLLGLICLFTTLQGVQGEVESDGPSEKECMPYIEKALKGLEVGVPEPAIGDSTNEPMPSVTETVTTDETDTSDEQTVPGAIPIQEESEESGQDATADAIEKTAADMITETEDDTREIEDTETASSETEAEAEQGSPEDAVQTEQSNEVDVGSLENIEEVTEQASTESAESIEEVKSGENVEPTEEPEAQQEQEAVVGETGEDQLPEVGAESAEIGEIPAEDKSEKTISESVPEDGGKSVEESEETNQSSEKTESVEDNKESVEDNKESVEDNKESVEDNKDSVEDNKESVEDNKESAEDNKESVEDNKESVEDNKESVERADNQNVETEATESVEEQEVPSEETDVVIENREKDGLDIEVKEDVKNVQKSEEESQNTSVESNLNADAPLKEEPLEEAPLEEVQEIEDAKIVKREIKEVHEAVPEIQEGDDSKSAEVDASSEDAPVEELSSLIEIPENLRSCDHVYQILKLDDRNSETENVINKISDITLRDLKRLYESAIKPLETLYKYRDLSNRHFGDPEIFSKPLVLFMGPWSGGKSSIINYLTDNEYTENSLKTGAEPSPAYFNILMYGDEPEVLDGTQLAADFTFAGLQKFGQGLEERLRGLKLPSKLLKKMNIVEIPGILEVRKQISRVFPFNDACQWFIDRADIIFLVYDPSKLDVGPETEAILDQLKGRESQTRIILNKADQVKPEELMRVQGALIWNISPLMSSAQPPLMYSTSLWSRPYESGAPVRLLQAQERAFLRDLRSAIDKRIENKISSARRFAVRVRNHAKMVDCYLTTYYNHKSVFGNRKQVSDQIVEHPQDYHIYEGLSTLTNISRYDLPDPDVYKGFFGLNPLYEFQQLSATCTYFRGCPINRLDVAIAYDLPEMLGKHKKLIETALAQLKTTES